MQSLIRSKSAGVTGGRGTAGAGPGRDLLQVYNQQGKDEFFFSQSYKGGPCPAQRHLLNGHASCVTSDSLFFA